MTLKAHHLRPAPGAHTPRTRKGRGEASKGKTAGRGTKGTGARGTVPARFEGGQMPLQMRLPKLKGFTSPNRIEYQVVNIAVLARHFPAGAAVTAEALAAAGLVRQGRPVKILGHGEIEVSVSVQVTACSASARRKIEAAGGSVIVDETA